MSEKETCIHIEPIKSDSEQHNKRLKKLDYVREDLQHLNESWEIDSISNRLEEAKKVCKEKTGRKMQSKAAPIRDGVVVIKEDTTIEELKNFAKILEDKWGIKCFQIHTHKDEGYKNAKVWTPNLHAHMIFDWTNYKTGKSIKLSRGQYAEMQTILAKTLGMKRGQSSDKKHLNALQFKVQEEEKRLAELYVKLEKGYDDYDQMILETENLVIEKYKKNTEISKLEMRISELEGKKQPLEDEINNLSSELSELHQKYADSRFDKKYQDMQIIQNELLLFEREKKALQNKITELSQISEKAEELKAELEKEVENLKLNLKAYKNTEKVLETLKNERMKIVEEQKKKINPPGRQNRGMKI